MTHHFPARTANFRTSLGSHQPQVEQVLKQLEQTRIIERIWQSDPTVWEGDQQDIKDRLGWLHSPAEMTEHIPAISAFVDEVRHKGFQKAVLLGMGGSSLAPELFRQTFGARDEYLDLIVLDSTDADTIRNNTSALDLSRTLFVVATKSGGTVETLSLMKHCYGLVVESVGTDRAGEQFVAITDPGSGLEAMARELKFRHTFLNNPHIGGRYSALSFFGLVPAALVGIDLERLLESARSMAEQSLKTECCGAEGNTAARLGIAMGHLAMAGIDKLTLLTSPQIGSLGAWIEQLVAESTGKHGKGILPVAGAPLTSAEHYGRDRLFVCLRVGNDSSLASMVSVLKAQQRPLIEITLNDIYDLGGEILRWELATAVTGHLLGINPFDQPNVESAKVSAREALAAYQSTGLLPREVPTFESAGIEVYGGKPAESAADALDKFLHDHLRVGDQRQNRSYIALQAYIHQTLCSDDLLSQCQVALQKRFGVAATVGYGPRFLHSTGQLHKGDGGHGLLVQITSDPHNEVPIPNHPGSQQSEVTFNILKNAQAMGDLQALKQAGRKVIRFHLGSEVETNLEKLFCRFLSSG